VRIWSVSALNSGLVDNPTRRLPESRMSDLQLEKTRTETGHPTIISTVDGVATALN